MNFDNKVVFITGANRGIGKALVFSVLKRGVKKIYATARDVESLPDFSDDRVAALRLDITDQEQISAAVTSAPDVDILINNAGVAAFSSIVDGSIEAVERDMTTNYYGTLNMVRAFVPLLEKKKQSSIVNMVTIGAFVNFPILGGYCASKSALFSMSQGIRIELQPKGISVHTVNPGPIDTDMAKDFDDPNKPTAEVTAENIISALEHGEEDIFPDATGKGMFDLWKNSYRDLEKAVFEMHHS